MNFNCMYCKLDYQPANLDRPRCTHCQRPNPPIVTTESGAFKPNTATDHEAKTNGSLGPLPSKHRLVVKASKKS